MNRRINTAILDLYDGVPNEGMRCIKQLLSEFYAKENYNGSYTIFNVRGEAEVPSIHEFDIYISTGGPGSPLIEGHEWENKLFGLYDSIFEHNKTHEKKKYLFLICHSFQLIAQHFDIGDVTKRKSTSFGVMPIHKEGDGYYEPLFEGLEDTFWGVDSRDYQLIQPNLQKISAIGASVVALEKIRPHVNLERAVMAIRYSDEVFSTQFHPEADAEGMYHYFQQEEKRNAVITNYGEEKYEEMLAHLEDPDKIMLTEATIIPRFLETSANAILGINQTNQHFFI